MPLHVRLAFAVLFYLATVGCACFGQSKKSESPFPTYRQIKASQPEIIDQVPASNTFIKTTAARVNLFNYPPKTVTYYLNDQPTTDVKYVKEVLNNKSISVETISISSPTEDGKRTIRIRYEAL
ncbi:hypothetical protein [Spirosoma oryzicola]|uniref:hypothetical protein n=1 Tax=Spirosoma oryzicola TaxID=2898794 RepID=UPI001E52D613|nr:hypothetical protein [Spirosoma oryzicola]UHG93009.1 hypothetical protein LQ777_08930 [Spirosoma oryzicola]